MSNNSNCICKYHILLLPKFRAEGLSSSFKFFIEDNIFTVANKYNYVVIKHDVKANYIYVFVQLEPVVAPLDAVNIIKSHLTINLINKYTGLRGFYSSYGSIWQDDVYLYTDGNSDKIDEIIAFFKQ